MLPRPKTLFRHSPRKGKVEGIKEAKLAVAKQALKKGILIKDIADLTGLSESEIQENLS